MLSMAFLIRYFQIYVNGNPNVFYIMQKMVYYSMLQQNVWWKDVYSSENCLCPKLTHEYLSHVDLDAKPNGSFFPVSKQTTKIFNTSYIGDEQLLINYF